MLIYALVFLVIVTGGLWLLWDFMEAYEQSRPVNTIKNYVDQLTVEDLCEGSDQLLSTLDSNIQSPEESRQIIRDASTGAFSYAKKSAESSETRQVYVLRCGRQVVGQFVISAGEADRYGFRVWEVTEESFDLSYLMGESVSVTVPSDFTVSVNGFPLDSSYITEQDIPYTTLEAFYGEYPLPTMVTYTADSFLGSYTMEVTDRNGKNVEITAETDYNPMLPACTDKELERIDELMDQFLTRYVAFTGSSSGTAGGNYNRLIRHLVPDGALAKRLYTAIDGLHFAQSLRDTIKKTQVNQYANLGNGRFYCDITYDVETVGKKGPVMMTYNMKVIMLETEEGLRVEGMTRY